VTDVLSQDEIDQLLTAIASGDDEPVGPVTGGAAVGFDPTVSVLNTGVVLDIEGTVSADRRYVTMTVRPSLAQPTIPLRTVPVAAVAGGTVGGGVGAGAIRS